MRLGRRPNIPKALGRAWLVNQRGISPAASQQFGAHVRMWEDLERLRERWFAGSLVVEDDS
jgi:hypothetical protein